MMKHLFELKSTFPLSHHFLFVCLLMHSNATLNNEIMVVSRPGSVRVMANTNPR